MWWNPWKPTEKERRVTLDEHWIDHATADGSPWSDDIPHGDLTDESTPSS